MQHATPTRKNRDCRVEDPGVGLGQSPRGERYHGGWGLGSRNTRGPCPPGRLGARPSSARPPLSSPSMGEPHSAGRTQSNDASSTGGPAESRVVVPRPPGGQAAEGWFQTTSQDAPRGSPKPPYTRGSASPLGKSHGGQKAEGCVERSLQDTPCKYAQAPVRPHRKVRHRARRRESSRPGLGRPCQPEGKGRQHPEPRGLKPRARAAQLPPEAKVMG